MRNRDFLTHRRISFRCRSRTGRSAGTQFVRLFHQMPHTLAVDQQDFNRNTKRAIAAHYKHSNRTLFIVSYRQSFNVIRVGVIGQV